MSGPDPVHPVQPPFLFELLNDPWTQLFICIMGISGLLFSVFCFVVVVGDYVLRFYEHLQKKRRHE